MSNRLLLLLALCICSGPIARAAEEDTDREVVVSGREAGDEQFEEPGGYGQPQWAERSRASATTKLYVLSPFEVFAGLLSESDVLRRRGNVHDLTQEIELGLPSRFELDLENQVGVAGSRFGETKASVGLRYALTNWGKLPLNPALSATYHAGIGERITDRFTRASADDEENSYELRVLLGQEFVPRLQWAANLFFEHELGSGRERQIGFTQDIAYLAIADKLEIGTEMRYTNATRRRERRDAANEFVIGPSVSWKPNLHTVVSVAPLIGCTPGSPRLAILTSISLEFGGGESKTAAISRQ